MNSNSMMRIGIHAIVLIAGVTVALMVPSKITTQHIISVICTAFAYLVFAASTVLGSMDDLQHATQNTGVTIAALFYLIAALLVSVVTGLMQASVKTVTIFQIIVMAAGIVFVMMMYMAKKHIDGQ
ncbi:MAG: hypothetical protein K6A40_06735 [Solobacterium sp.]|nr:hypothetical protein [Solobacterium sp.]